MELGCAGLCCAMLSCAGWCGLVLRCCWFVLGDAGRCCVVLVLDDAEVALSVAGCCWELLEGAG